MKLTVGHLVLVWAHIEVIFGYIYLYFTSFHLHFVIIQKHTYVCYFFLFLIHTKLVRIFVYCTPVA